MLRIGQQNLVFQCSHSQDYLEANLATFSRASSQESMPMIAAEVLFQLNAVFTVIVSNALITLPNTLMNNNA